MGAGTIDAVTRSGSAAPFVGRAEEVRRLVASVEGATAGEPSAWLVAGDAGVGKTRFLAEVADRARAVGAAVVVGRCVDLGAGGLPYLPFAEVVGRLAARDDLADEVASRPALDALTGTASARSPTVGAADGDHRLPLFDAVRGLLAEAGRRSGALVVVVEDLHWADQSSRDLLRFLVARLRDEHVVVVASYRTDDLHRRHPLRQMLPDLVRLPQVERVELAPFDAGELSTYLRGLTGAPVDGETVASVLVRSEGNAYFAEELMACGGGAVGALPSALADVLLARVERLSAAGQGLARVASVAGRRVTDDLLMEVSGLPPADVDAALREAVTLMVLVPDPGVDGTPGYGFRHSLLREAVYADLLPGERVRLHAAYADLLSSPEHRGIPGAAAALAHHAMAAHQLAPALRAGVEAAREATATRAPAEALVHLEHALTLWDAVPDAAQLTGTDRVRLALAAAEAAGDAGEPARAVALATEARDRARRPDAGRADVDTELLARSELQLALHLYVVDRDHESLDAAQRAMDLLHDRPLSEVAVRAAGMRSRTAAGLAHGRDVEESAAASRSAEQALDGARRLGLTDVESDVLITLASLDEAAGDAGAAAERLVRARDLARAGGHHATELRAEYNLAGLRYYGGDVAGAIELLPAVVALADGHGLTWSAYGLEARVLQVIAEYVAGSWESSARASQLAGRRPPDGVAARLATAELYTLVARGDHGAAARVGELESAWHHDGQIALVAGGCGADLLAWQGRHAEAVAAAQRAIDYVSRSWGEWYLGGIWLAALALGAQADAVRGPHRSDDDAVAAAVDGGRRLLDDARARAARGRPRAGTLGPEALAWLARAEAEFARLQGRDDVDAWERSVDAFAYGYPYEQSRSRWRLAEALVSAGRRQEAAVVAGTAHATAVALGAAPLAACLEALVRRARLDVRLAAPASATRPAGPDVLTAREREVLALLSDGLTNGQIGRALFISPKTASVHVSNLIAKLGASGRTEVVAIAYRRGLLETP